MSRINIIIGFLVSLLFLLIAGCNLSTDNLELVPYSIDGKFICGNDNSEYKIGAINCSFKNISEKAIKKLYIVFSLFDDNGVPLQQNAIEVTMGIPANGDECFFINLDKYLSENKNENYYIDFIYASKIIYEDSSEWTDPLGIKNFI